ncbi:MAG: PLDc N-terminal domain-containing protein [Ilumatobacteraceae bacterium]
MSELSILLLVILPFVALLVWSIIEIGTRSDLDTLRRIGWFLAVVILPVIGLAAYVVVRPPQGVRRSGGHADTAMAEAIVLLAERRQRSEISDEEFRVEVGAIASID